VGSAEGYPRLPARRFTLARQNRGALHTMSRSVFLFYEKNFKIFFKNR
jgi:hypothetical protein